MLLLVLFVRIALPQGLQRIISDANCYWQWQKWAVMRSFLATLYYLLHRHFYSWQLKEVAHRNSSCKLHYAIRSHHNHHQLVDDHDDDDDDANAFLLKRPLGHFHCR